MCSQGVSPKRKRSPWVAVTVVGALVLGVVIVWALIEGAGGPSNSASVSIIGKHATLSLSGGVTMEFVYIAPGTFTMGSPANEEDRDDDETQHRVTLKEGYYMGVHEVTQSQYEAVMGTNPSHFKGEQNPVEMVSWHDAKTFCEKLSRATGKAVRLPTEAEWEYACRAGTTTPFHTGRTISTDQANNNGNFTYGGGRKGVYRRKTIAVGSFSPNAWGLYDMHGNVWEWCSDWADEDYYENSPARDPKGPATGKWRVLRGGSWAPFPGSCRSADRAGSTPGNALTYIGFRVIFSPRP